MICNIKDNILDNIKKQKQNNACAKLPRSISTIEHYNVHK